MIQRRTDNMAKRYGLNEQQTKALLELNTRQAEKMMSPRRTGSKAMQGRCTCNCHRKANRRMRSLSKEEMKARRQKAAEARKSYEEGLKKIFTPEQYDRYTAQRKAQTERRKAAMDKRRTARKHAVTTNE